MGRRDDVKKRGRGTDLGFGYEQHEGRDCLTRMASRVVERDAVLSQSNERAAGEAAQAVAP